MKRIILSSLLAFLLILGSIPAGAEEQAQSALIDPLLPIIMIPFPMDPCFGATFRARLSTITTKDLSAASDYWTHLNIRDITFTGMAVSGKLIQRYNRILSGADAKVMLEDTIILNDGYTIFGRASNDVAGIAGATGLILGAVDSFGNSVDFKAGYRYSSYPADLAPGELEICIFEE